MFSDSRTPAPGEQKGFKPHAPHFIPWLRNSLKPQHSGDLGLNGPYKSNTEVRNNMTPLERARGMGLFSIHGKDRAKKGELRCNGVGMGRMLPVVLRGHHILPGSLGKQKDDSPARWTQPAELDPDSNMQISPGDGPRGPVSSSASVQHEHGLVRSSYPSPDQSKNDGTSTTGKPQGSLMGPCPTPGPGPLTKEPTCKFPVVVCMDDGWDHTSYRQGNLHSSSWLSSDTQGLTDRQRGFGSSFSYAKHQSRKSESQRDLTAPGEPPVEGFNASLNGVIFSTADPQRGLDCTATLRGPGKPRPSSERSAVLGQNRLWVQHRPKSEGTSRRKEAGCSMKVVRKQIKCVVDNLEHVLTALRDVHQEMKEVVQQIDYLTSSMDLNEEDHWWTGGDDGSKPPSDSSSSSGSNSSKVTAGSTLQSPSELQEQPGATGSSGTIRRNHRNAPLCSASSGLPSERSQTLRFTYRLSSYRQGGAHSNNLPSSNPSQLQSQDCTLSPQRNPPVRPPTPGLSPLTVSLHPPSRPGSQPHSPVTSPSIRVSSVSSPSRVSTQPHPPSVLSPSVIIETKVGSYQTPQSDHPSVGPLSPSTTPSASCPPTDSEIRTVSDADRERASSAGPAQGAPRVRTATVPTAKPPTTQGRRGHKPPPYPHHRLSEHTKKAKEPRKAPPYPEKRRLLSTTV